MRTLSWQVHVILTTILITVLLTEPIAAQESAPHVTSAYAASRCITSVTAPLTANMHR
jgi:hypothetical protein